ncbi:MAG: 4Fe-4S dicluster domain-containing protein [Candidatus Hydrothermarchaeota archaeon]|nr:4Fe-4S dicluster domain-containing protein [Candidatus Hydrothermarchaeota archaeon]
MNLLEFAKKTKFDYCIGCGKCTGACPIAEYIDGAFSPRAIIRKINLGIDVDEAALGKCNLCAELKINGITIPASRPRCVAACPQKVNFFGFISMYRRKAG